MKNDIAIILQSCDTIRTLNEEFKKPFGWTKFKEKKELKELENQIFEKIDKLIDDYWDKYYIIAMENAIIAYYDKLKPYMNNFFIRDYNKENLLDKFKPITITEDDSDYVMTIDIISDTITFSIFKTTTGQYVELVSGTEITNSQKIVEKRCKRKLIEILKQYLEDIISDKK